MARTGVSARPARRYAAPWWEELDREAFREFPANGSGRTRAGATGRPARAATATDDVPPAPRSSAIAGAPASRIAPPRNPAPALIETNGRRTITIRGRGAERNLPVTRPALRRHERPGFRPDRAALWAVLLGLFLILVAAVSAHGAVLAHAMR
jgi:hypothetical protein